MFSIIRRGIISILFCIFFSSFSFAQIVKVFAGGGAWQGENKKSISTQVKPNTITTDKLGVTYVYDDSYGVIRKISVDSIITTFAGNGVIGYNGDGNDALNASIDASGGMATDINGNLYISDRNNRVIRVIDNNHKISTIAGLGSWPFEGNPAIKSNLSPLLLALDSIGNTFFYDPLYYVIRKIDTSGKLYTIAGNGQYGYTGDSSLAVKAKINVSGLAVDNKGNVYFSDANNNVVRKVASTGIISTIAGDGSGGYNGDSINAKNAKLNSPASLTLDNSGNIYISDIGNNRIRKISKDGIITTIIGSSVYSFSGDGGNAANATINVPGCIKFDNSGNLYFSDNYNFKIRKISTTGIVSTFAGVGTQGSSGDGGAAINAQFGYDLVFFFDKNGNTFILDKLYGVIRKINNIGNISTQISSVYYSDVNIDLNGNIICANYNKNYIEKINSLNNISIFAGTGMRYNSGDGSLASKSEVYPSNIYVDANLNIYFSDNINHVVRKIDNKGIIYTIAGNGKAGYSGDGNTSIYAQLNTPKGITVDKDGNVYIADYGNNRIRVVYNSGTIVTLYGNGSCCAISSDGVLAKNISIRPSYMYFDNNNVLYFADNNGVRVRKINTDGLIYTVAGNGATGSTGDGGLATAASIDGNYGVSFDQLNQIYIADYNSNKIRKVYTNGNINTYAGNGFMAHYSGDGEIATSAEMGSLYGLCADNVGNIYMSDLENCVVRKVSKNGIITTIAGSGVRGNTGDGGLAINARLASPRSICVDKNGNLYIADAGNNRVRKVSADGIITTFAGSGTNTGDSILATSAQLAIVRGVYADSNNNVYIICNYKVRMVDSSGKIYTIAGVGQAGFGGDNGPAKQAMFNAPQTILKDKRGNLLVADLGNNRIRKISPAGIINTIIGNGTSVYNGDSVRALNAQVYPWGMCIDTSGSIFFVDAANYRVCKLTTDSLVVNVSGNGVSGNLGDGSDANKAQLSNPLYVNIDLPGNLYFTDVNRVRKISIPELSTKLVDTVCNNSAINLSLKSLASNVQYTWSKIGTNTQYNTSVIKDTAINSNSSFTKVNYKVNMNVNGFKNSQEVNLYIKPLLPIPVITRDTLNYLNSSKYPVVWLNNGNVITTDSNTKYKPNSNGTYSVKYIENGCKSEASSSYFYLVTDIINLEDNQFIKVAPNPFTSNLYLNFFLKQHYTLNADVFELNSGSIVANRKMLSSGANLNLASLAPGVYVIRVYSDDLKLTYTFKAVKI